MRQPPDNKTSLKDRWTELEAQRTPILNRAEMYSAWTLPWLFPPASTQQTDELPKTYGSLGARCVNHLANRFGDVLFPVSRPYFRAKVSKDVEALAESLGYSKEAVEQGLAKIELESREVTGVADHRTKATEALKYLIVCGNVMIYYKNTPMGRVPMVYSLRDYCVVRAHEGHVIELLLKECKLFGECSDEIKGIINAERPHCDDTEKLELYTQWKWDAEKKRYNGAQCIEGINLKSPEDLYYSKAAFPYLTLTWNRRDGESYGRGMVEDYERDFHAYNVLTVAQTQTVAIMSDIKRGLRPESILSPDELDRAPIGTTVACDPNDVFWIGTDTKQFDIAGVSTRLAQIEQTLAGIFMLTSASVRDAERVTAEEIRMQIRELETALGGVYSRVASEWQGPLATIQILDSNPNFGPDTLVRPLIITGMDAMSRSAEIESIYLVFQDLQALQSIGNMQRWVNEGSFVRLCCANRGVDPDKVFKSPEQVQQEDMARMQQEQVMQEQATQAALTQEAMKEV